MERLTYKYNDGYAINLPNAISGKDETLRWSISERESGLRLEGEIPNRLAAYEDTGLEPQEIKSLQAEWAANLKALDAYRALGSVDRLRELAQADREGRVKIEQKSYSRCPKCGKLTLFPRIDWKYYYCYSCKTQFTKDEYEAALRREQDD